MPTCTPKLFGVVQGVDPEAVSIALGETHGFKTHECHVCREGKIPIDKIRKWAKPGDGQAVQDDSNLDLAVPA